MAYIAALTEIIASFAFRLDRDMSSGIEELMMRLREPRKIENGRVFVDDSHLKQMLRELEHDLRKQREHFEGGIPLFWWRLLDENVVRPWSHVNSRAEEPVQIADILASIVKL